MGISLGRNPDGAAPQIGAGLPGVRPVRRRRRRRGRRRRCPLVLRHGPTSSTNWSFFAAMVVFVFGVVPVTPGGAARRRAAAAGRAHVPTAIWLVGVLGGRCHPVGATITSNGMPARAGAGLDRPGRPDRHRSASWGRPRRRGSAVPSSRRPTRSASDRRSPAAMPSTPGAARPRGGGLRRAAPGSRCRARRATASRPGPGWARRERAGGSGDLGPLRRPPGGERRARCASRAAAISGLIGPNGAGKTTTVQRDLRRDHADLGHGADSTGRDISRTRHPQAGPPGHRPDLPAPRGVHLADGARERAGRPRDPPELVAAARARSRSTSPAAADPPPDAEVDLILDRLDLADLADVLVGSLPTGQARLVELGRALAARPSVLLLDEPASGLDDDETEAFGDAAGRRSPDDGLGILLVEHDVGLVMQVCCEHLSVLDFGQVIASGDPGRSGPTRRSLAAYLGTAIERRPRGGRRMTTGRAAARAPAASAPPTGRSRCCTASTWPCPPGIGGRAARAQRRGQDHHAVGRLRPDGADRGLGAAGRPST